MTANATVTAHQVYKVKNGSRLTLEVVVGDGQSGGSSIIWLGDIIDFPPKSWPYELATDGGAVRNRTLHCTTRVREVSSTSHKTSATFKLRGGEKDQDFPYEITVPKPNDYATYIIDFTFI